MSSVSRRWFSNRDAVAYGFPYGAGFFVPATS